MAAHARLKGIRVREPVAFLAVAPAGHAPLPDRQDFNIITIDRY